MLAGDALPASKISILRKTLILVAPTLFDMERDELCCEPREGSDSYLPEPMLFLGSRKGLPVFQDLDLWEVQVVRAEG